MNTVQALNQLTESPAAEMRSAIALATRSAITQVLLDVLKEDASSIGIELPTGLPELIVPTQPEPVPDWRVRRPGNGRLTRSRRRSVLPVVRYRPRKRGSVAVRVKGVVDEEYDRKTKRCRECGEVKRLVDFRLNKRCADGHVSICEDCIKARSAAKRARRTAKIPPVTIVPPAVTVVPPGATGVGTKVCKRCQEEKPLSEFPLHGKTKDGHTSFCRSCSTPVRKPKERPKPKPGLSELIQERYAGTGVCSCGQYDTLYTVEDNGEPICYGCLQARMRDPEGIARARSAKEKVVRREGFVPICANPECNEPTRSSGGKGPTKYCSLMCRNRAAYLRAKARRAAAAATS